MNTLIGIMFSDWTLIGCGVGIIICLIGTVVNIFEIRRMNREQNK